MVVKYTVKSRFWRKHYIFSQFMRSFCTWHFLENMFERCRFWRKCLIKKCRKLNKSKMSILTWKSKIVSQPDIVFAQLTHSDIRQIIFSAFWNYISLVWFWYISRAEFVPPTVCLLCLCSKSNFPSLRKQPPCLHQALALSCKLNPK